MRPLAGYSRPLEVLQRGNALLAVPSHLHLRRVKGARLLGFAFEYERLGVHAVVQVVSCPTGVSVVAAADQQDREVASSPPQRLALELQDGRMKVPALRKALEDSQILFLGGDSA